jgi:hypothetical protein
MSRTHLEEMRCKTPLDRAIWEATRNIAAWKDTHGTAKLDHEATSLAKQEVENRIRREFITQGEDLS